MLHFKCLACKTRHAARKRSRSDRGSCPVCGSLLEPVGDLVEIVGYGVIETRCSTSHSGGSCAGEPIADRVGEIIARREFKHTRVRLGIERCGARSVGPRVQAVGFRASGTGDDAVRRRRRPLTTAAPPRLPRVLGALDDGRHGRERRRQRKLRSARPRCKRRCRCRHSRACGQPRSVLRRPDDSSRISTRSPWTSRSFAVRPGRQAKQRHEPA